MLKILFFKNLSTKFIGVISKTSLPIPMLFSSTIVAMGANSYPYSGQEYQYTGQTKGQILSFPCPQARDPNSKVKGSTPSLFVQKTTSDTSTYPSTPQNQSETSGEYLIPPEKSKILEAAYKQITLSNMMFNSSETVFRTIVSRLNQEVSRLNQENQNLQIQLNSTNERISHLEIQGNAGTNEQNFPYICAMDPHFLNAVKYHGAINNIKECTMTQGTFNKTKNDWKNPEEDLDHEIPTLNRKSKKIEKSRARPQVVETAAQFVDRYFRELGKPVPGAPALEGCFRVTNSFS